MSVTPRQTDRWLGHDGAYCPAATGEGHCNCSPWECRNCGQRYDEDEGHSCPAEQRVGVLDPRD